jgi:ethanolamine permease
MKVVVGARSGWLRMLVWLGLFGLVASFHGIILGYSRQIFALARAGYLPRSLARVHSRFRTPHRAIIAGAVVGIAAIYSDRWVTLGGQTLTANIVIMSVFGAITMYLISMFALFQLRRTRPDLNRTFKVPFYPAFPLIAVASSLVCLASMIYSYALVAILFFGLLACGFVYFKWTGHLRVAPD